jgi:hypothetical protein
MINVGYQFTGHPTLSATRVLGSYRHQSRKTVELRSATEVEQNLRNTTADVDH